MGSQVRTLQRAPSDHMRQGRRRGGSPRRRLGDLRNRVERSGHRGPLRWQHGRRVFKLSSARMAQKHGVHQIRSRLYYKNDDAYVQQKHHTHVRQF